MMNVVASPDMAHMGISAHNLSARKRPKYLALRIMTNMHLHPFVPHHDRRSGGKSLSEEGVSGVALRSGTALKFRTAC